MKKWNKFLKVTKNRKPYPLVLEAISLRGVKKGLALDLGCGSGAESKALADQGLRVDAVDLEPAAIRRVVHLSKRINAINADISLFKIIPYQYEIIVAWNSIPFLNTESAKRLVADIQSGLARNGIAVISIFGPYDAWKRKKQMSFFTIEDIKKIWKKMEVIKTVEIKGKMMTVARKEKFGHLIQILARKS